MHSFTDGKENIIMPDGYLPDYKGDPILASCINCQHNSDISDGPECGGPFFACEKPGKEYMSNLKYWPFKTAQKCCDLHIMYTVDWDAEIKREKENDKNNQSVDS